MHEGLGGGVEGGTWEMVPFKSRFSYTPKCDIFFLWREEAAGGGKVGSSSFVGYGHRELDVRSPSVVHMHAHAHAHSGTYTGSSHGQLTRKSQSIFRSLCSFD